MSKYKNENKRFSNIPGYYDWSREQKIEYWSLSNNEVSINNGNAKTGKACLTCSMPMISCRPDAPCKQDCYCCKGNQAYANVQGAYHRNWRLWIENPERFEKHVNYKIEMNGLPLFRWNDCGDIVDEEYFRMMLRVAEQNPDVKFLAYTKKYELVNEEITRRLKEDKEILPDNFTLRFSMWDKNWFVPNHYNLPVAYVDFKKSELNPELPTKAFICPGSGQTTCSSCKVCFNKKVQNVIFHQH